LLSLSRGLLEEGNWRVDFIWEFGIEFT
jgi:hypothetical protein